MDEENKEYYVIFYYDSYTKGSYVVRFVEAGTELGNPVIIQQNVIAEENILADKAVLTLSINSAENLKNKGYMLVNRNDDGNTYSQAKSYKDLQWLDSKGNLHSLSTDLTNLLDEDVEKTITYLVQPIEYTITYQNADNSPKAANDALSAITAKNTSVSNAREKNPTLYTTKDSFTLKNPSKVYEDGKWYQFSHWSLGNGTTESGKENKTYTTLKVNQGSVGNLTFIANWVELIDIGNLKVSNTVSGNRGDTNQVFTFTIALSDNSINGTFGDITFTNGTVTFKLKHGESIICRGLPAGTKYTVEEIDNAGYIVTSSNTTGTIENGKVAIVEFNNHKNETVNPPDKEDPTNPIEPMDPTKPTNPSNPISSVDESPKTSDEINLSLWVELTIVSGIIIIFMLIISYYNKKERKD